MHPESMIFQKICLCFVFRKEVFDLDQIPTQKKWYFVLTYCGKKSSIVEKRI